MTPDFDVAVVSASPMGLSEALLLAREGKRVVVCDRRTQIGGAWRCEEAFGYQDLEVGCHIFIPNARIPIALKALWQVELISLSPAPRMVFHLRGRDVEDSYGAPFVAGLVAGLGAITRGASWIAGRRSSSSPHVREVAQLAWRSQHLLRESIRQRWAVPGPLVYPASGTGGIVRALRDRTLEAGVVVHLGSEVVEACVSKSGASLSLSDGSTIRAAQAVLTRGSDVAVLNGLTIPKREIVRRHWVVVLDDPTPCAFSYLHFRNHPAVERVSDVTRFARTLAGGPVEKGRKILCFFVTHTLFQQGRAHAEKVLLEIMKRRRWIGQAAEPLVSKWWEDVESSRDYRSLTLLQATNPTVRVITEANLGVYLLNNFDRISATPVR